MKFPKHILITGGAGYIGSHIAKELVEMGQNVVIFDNLSTGHKKAIDAINHLGNIVFIEGDLRNDKDLDKLFSKHSISSVVHVAAKCSVNESMENPAKYFSNNVNGTANLLKKMHEYDVKSVVFSSSCAVYGETQYLPVDEEHLTEPTNPYGESKKISETIIDWYSKTKGINYAILRYFNVCGADTDALIGDSKNPSPHLMQNAVRGALGIDEFNLTCPIVETHDGTPIRDYVDVRDLARAHALAIEKVDSEKENIIVNLGTNQGYSVNEIINEVESTLNVTIKKDKKNTRKGEYAEIYADYQKAKKILGWEPKYNLKDSVESLKNWYEKNPKGFN